MTVDSFSPEETYSLGRSLGEKAVPGQVYTLEGDLGVGKTVFTQGFARGLGITQPVCSPTFTIMMQYLDGRLPLYHFDVYRITDPEEMEEIGYTEYFWSDGVCLVEWADLIRDLIPADAVHVVIEKDPARGFDYRRIIISGERIQKNCGAVLT